MAEGREPVGVLERLGLHVALGRRREKGASLFALLRGVAARWGWLLAFGVYVQQITVGSIRGDSPTSTGDYLLALLGFGLLFLVCTRWPRGWSAGRQRWLTWGGVALCVGLVAWIHQRNGQPFSWGRMDIIIILLAHASLVASVAWLLTRGRLRSLRWAFMAIPLLAHHQAMKPGWRAFGDTFDPWTAVLQWPKRALDLTWIVDTPLLNFAPLYDFTWLKFVSVVLIGTFVGDRLRGAENQEAAGPRVRPTRGRGLLYAGGGLAACLLVLVGFAYDTPALLEGAGGIWRQGWLLATLAVPCGAAAWWAAGRTEQAPGDALLRYLAGFGTLLLVAGLLAEPWEGGIKKGPPATLSYYLISAAMSVLLLGVLAWAIDRRGTPRWPWGLLILNGQNPMLAYVAIRNLVAPLMGLPLLLWLGGSGPASVEAWMTQRWFHVADAGGDPLPWVLFLWGLSKTLLLAVAVALLTRGRVVWRV